MIHPTGGGRPLDAGVRTSMEQSFGADFSAVRVHEGSHVNAVGAVAYAQGTDLHFSPGSYAPDSASGRELIGHELAHVVQQSQGRVAATTQAKGVAVNNDASLEREADDLGTRAARGERVGSGASVTAGGDGPAQCYAFIGDKQVLPTDDGAGGAAAPMVGDTVVRSYDSAAELQDHAGGQTDYMGNLADGTWVKFSPKGTNVIGEVHGSAVTLPTILPAIKASNFVYEGLASDSLADAPNTKDTVAQQTGPLAASLGLEQGATAAHGGESLDPKIGYCMADLAATLQGGGLDTLCSGPNQYSGKPAQRYFSVAWSYSQDNLAKVTKKGEESCTAGERGLATWHTQLAPDVEEVLGHMTPDGFLGDAMKKCKDLNETEAAVRLFAVAVRDAIIEIALADPKSGLIGSQKNTLKDPNASHGDKSEVMDVWRNNRIVESVRAAVAAGVRYAGYGEMHLDDVKWAGIAANRYYMGGKDLAQFQSETQKLAGIAKPTDKPPETK